MIAINVLASAVIALHVYQTFYSMNAITDWMSGVYYKGHFAAVVMDAIRLAYNRGLFDGFVAGSLLVLILKRDRSK